MERDFFELITMPETQLTPLRQHYITIELSEFKEITKSFLEIFNNVQSIYFVLQM